jgi:diguanylate cyclase (GGDEF)-like protein
MVLASNILIGLAIAATALALMLHLRSSAARNAAGQIEALSLVLAEQAERAFGAVELVQAGIVEHLRLDGKVTSEDFRARLSGRDAFEDLRSRIRGLPQIDAITAIDAHGNLVNFSRFWPIPPVNVADRDYFTALSAAGSPGIFIGEPVPNRGSGAWTITIARKVTSADGNFLGLLLGAIRLDYFELLYRGVAHRPGSSFALLRRDGILLARYPALPHIGESFASSTIFQQLDKGGRDGAAVAQVSRIDGQARLVSQRPLATYPLVVGASLTSAAVNAEWRVQAAVLGGAALLLEVLITLAAWMMLRQLRHQRLLGEAHAAAAAAQSARLGAEAQLALAQERDRAARDSHQQNIRFDLAMSNMAHGLCMFDQQDRLVIANRKFHEMFALPQAGCAPGTALGDLPRLVAGADDAAAVFGVGGFGARTDLEALVRALRHLIAAGRPAAHLRDMEDGRSLAISFKPVEHQGWLATMEDITERRRAEAQIVHMAHHDALTGLPNRVLFLERLNGAIARARRGNPCSVMCLDLDQFKAVNDTLGHPVGDALLQAVTARLLGLVRETDIVARLGGDEFAIVQDSVDQPGDATALARRLIADISAPYEINGHQVVIGTSIGIAVVPGDGDDPVRILKNADMALYRAKGEGRGRYRFFETEMERAAQLRRLLELDLRKALNEGAFKVFYQPLMNMRSGTVSAFEALLRWTHPERGAVPPAEFIPLAEEIGLIGRLGQFVLRQACADAAGWPAEVPADVKVAVNISAVQFTSATLAADVADALNRSGLDPGRLELEVTESVMLDDTQGALAVLHRLRALGIGIAMDDFGSGYSSLSYLRLFPFTKVKIDRSFIEGLGQGADCEAIVEAVSGLCDSLGMITVAEGVETAQQLRVLRGGKCTEAQGFLFSRAAPAAEVARLCVRLNEAGRMGRPLEGTGRVLQAAPL